MRYLTLVVATLSGAACLLQACTQNDPRSELRILNSSSYDVEDLVVIFPEQEIAFGNVAAGGASRYEEVQGGVYRCGAFRFEIDGERLGQV